jgi:hypothetical protein
LNDKNKKLKIIGIEHSIEWIEKMKKELEKSDAVILEL